MRLRRRLYSSIVWTDVHVIAFQSIAFISVAITHKQPRDKAAARALHPTLIVLCSTWCRTCVAAAPTTGPTLHYYLFGFQLQINNIKFVLGIVNIYLSKTNLSKAAAEESNVGDVGTISSVAIAERLICDKCLLGQYTSRFQLEAGICRALVMISYRTRMTESTRSSVL